ncbi:MAG: HEAT repeat domain-containing protein [Myxococcales bacterium]
MAVPIAVPESVSLPIGLFRGFAPFDEASSEILFGRAVELAALLERVLSQNGRVVTVTGESGVGKTSLVRAGLAPALRKRGIPVLYLASPDDLDEQALRAGHASAGSAPATGESSADYVARLARESRAGMVMVLDHLEHALSDQAGPGAASAVSAFVSRVVEGAGPKVHLVLVIEREAFPHLDRLLLPPAFRASGGFWYTVERLDEAAVAEILERTAVLGGTLLEAGLPALMAADLCRDQRCLPLDLQLCARAMIDLRVSSIRRYQSSGGVATLRAMFFEQVLKGAPPGTRRVLLAVAACALPASLGEIEERTNLPHPAVAEAVHVLSERGLLQQESGPPAPAPAEGQANRNDDDRFALAHPALRPSIESFGIEDRARNESVRRRMRARMMAGGRLTLGDLFAVHRTLGPALSPSERTLFVDSLRRHLIQAAVIAGVVIALGATFVVGSREGYVLAFDPPGGDGTARATAAARVVVRSGRPRGGLASLFSNRANGGPIIADTGFSAAGLVPASTARIAAGQAGGTVDPAQPGGVPSWLREVVNGLRPVPRGVAKALIGDADGVTSLKHAFSEPLTRRETLDALAVIGRGRAGEEEILSAALGDAAPEIRRRGVEVAAAIDRRLGNGAHAAILRNALADKSPDVRLAVLREVGTLPPRETSEILAVALADRDPVSRRAAEDATLALAARNPEAAAAAAERLLESADTTARRNGLPLLERIADRAPAACAAVLQRLVANPNSPEEARVAGLLALRKAGAPPPSLKPALELAVGQSSSPRLRAAALPLYARLIDPTRAEEIARAEMKGPPPSRAAATAVWGAIAVTRPDLAAKPLKGLVYDPSVEVRIEAARAFAYLKRDGLSLVEKALKDPNAEVERAAIDSALALAPINPNAVATMLGKAVVLVRPAVRRQIVEALGRLGETRPAAALPPLAHALKDPDLATRAAVATAFCVLARKNAVAASPYLRIAARDDARDVRAAAASCLDELVAGDPQGGARMAAELASADAGAVRAAAALSLGRLAARAPDAALGSLFRLLDDSDSAVRDAAARGLTAFGESGAAGPGFAESKRGAEAERALIAAMARDDVAERQLVVTAAAKNRLAGVLRQATSDGDESVRLQAVQAAGTLTPPALDVVREAVDDRSPLVRGAATRILAAATAGGAKEVLPIYEAALRGGDHAARQAAIRGLGELSGEGVAAARLLSEALQQRSESVRTSAAEALGRLAERDPGSALPVLERALHDPSYDVASAAVPGLAAAWSLRMTPDGLAATLSGAEADSARRFVALEALVLQAQRGATPNPTSTAAVAALKQVADSGPPLARLAAQLGRAFLGTPSADIHTFVERLLGG